MRDARRRETFRYPLRIGHSVYRTRTADRGSRISSRSLKPEAELQLRPGPSSRNIAPLMRTRTFALGVLLLSILGCAQRTAPAAPAATATATTGVVTLSIVGTNDLHGGSCRATGAAGWRCSAGTWRTCARRARRTAAPCCCRRRRHVPGHARVEPGRGRGGCRRVQRARLHRRRDRQPRVRLRPGRCRPRPRARRPTIRAARSRRAPPKRSSRSSPPTSSIRRPAPRRSGPTSSRSAIVEAAGVKVGIVGLMTRGALTATISSNVRDLSVAPLADSHPHPTRRDCAPRAPLW